jgi:hypothetical protein
VVKFFVILLLALGLVGILYWLIHPYIRMARKALGFIQGVRTGMFETDTTGVRERQPVAAQKLIKCTRCGTWIPMERALHARSGEYCSAQCRDNRT